MSGRTTTGAYRFIHRVHRRRGIAVVLVLGVLAIALAISYATLRGQGTTTQLARNNSRSLEARAAAHSGVAAALSSMSDNGWGGVTSGLQSNVTANSKYVVTFNTGDDKLQATDALYSEWPFRVTIDSIGIATDPLNTAIQSQYKCRCVVQLLRKQLVAEPANWDSTDPKLGIINQNLYQFSNQDAYVQFPVRINGNATLLGKLKLCTEYPGSALPRDRYLTGLQQRAATLGDYRPFALGKLYLKGLATSQQDSTTVNTMLTTDLQTPPVEAVVTAAPPSHPGAPSSYKLYPGGADYTVPALGSSLSGKTIGPDVKLNPLGIYRTTGSLTIQDNVQITGTIITENSGGAEIQVPLRTTNVVLKGNNLPALYGSSTVYQLPTLIARSNIIINKGADVQITGAALCWSTFEIFNDDTTAANSTKLAVTGNLITDTFKQHGRSTWTLSALQWTLDQVTFTAQALLGTPYFPDWEQSQRGFTVKPTLTFSPDSSGVKPHWHDWTQAVYQPDPAGDPNVPPGLKWEVVRWEENVQ